MRGIIRPICYAFAGIALATLFWVAVYAVMSFIMWEWQPIWPTGYQLYRATELVSALVGFGIGMRRSARG